MDKEKKMTRSEKMYKDSPKLTRTESGKMGVTKKQKESAETNSGTDGMAEHESHVTEMMHKHAGERLDLHHKQEKEHMEMMHKHAKKAAQVEPETDNEGE